MRKAALHNLGCKVNAYETEAMQELLEQAGYSIVPFHEQADVYIINTCSVTNMADRKSRQQIHRARKQNPEAVIVAAGCYVQALEDAGKTDENVDIIIGNNRKKDLVPILEAYFRERSRKKDVVDIGHTNEYENLTVSRQAEHTRAYVKVQDGCNQFCTYCIIPYTRGRVRSRNKEDVIREVTVLAQNGYQEVVLTGIHLSSYGRDLEEGNTLLELVEAVAAVEGISRIRLGSLEPGIITEAFAKRLASIPEICPHFHLSLQSGCDATLKRMNRKYTTADYREKCRILRDCFDNPALTTDVIAGFPGETEEEFQTSLAFVDDMDFYETHIFKYSRRQGTKAADMPGQITEAVKTERSGRYQELNRKKQEQYEKSWAGKRAEVLFEDTFTGEGGSVWRTGHTREYLKVAVPAKEARMNERKWIEIVNPVQIIH